LPAQIRISKVPVIVLALEHVIAERDVEVELAGIVGPESCRS
jgi:hypothetical protein